MTQIDDAIEHLKELKENGTEPVIFEAWPKEFFGAFTEDLSEEQYNGIVDFVMYDADWENLNQEIMSLVEEAIDKCNKQGELEDEYESYTG